MNANAESNATSIATVDEFLSAVDESPKLRTVMGKSFYVATLSASQRGQLADATSSVMRRMLFVVFCMVDSHGNPMFNDESAAKFLNIKSELPERVLDVIINHNTMAKNEEELSGE